MKAYAKNIQATMWYLISAGGKIARGPYARQQDAKVATYQTKWPAMQNNPIMFTAVRGAKLIEHGMLFASFYKELTAVQTANATKRADKEALAVKARTVNAKKSDDRMVLAVKAFSEKKPVTKRVTLIDRISVELRCPHCGEDTTITHAPIGKVLVCSNCSGKFRISAKAKVTVPTVLRPFLTKVS